MYRYQIVLCLLLLNSIIAFGQQDSKMQQALNRIERKNAVKLNLLSPFYGTVNVAWQHVISNDVTFQVTGSYTDFDSYGSSGSYDRDQLTTGFTIVPEYRFVLNGRGMSGLYIAPFARYMYYEYSFEDVITTYSITPPYSVTTRNKELYSYNSLGLGVVVGKQFVFKNRVVVDLFGGPVYSILLTSNKSINKTSDVMIGDGIPNTYIRGYGVRGGFTVGFLF